MRKLHDVVFEAEGDDRGSYPSLAVLLCSWCTITKTSPSGTPGTGRRHGVDSRGSITLPARQQLALRGHATLQRPRNLLKDQSPPDGTLFQFFLCCPWD